MHLALERKTKVLIQRGAEMLYEQLTLMLPEDVSVHRAQCRSGDCRGDDPLHEDKS